MHDRSDFYDLLNRRTLWVRWNGGEETGHSAMSLPTGAIIRSEPADPVLARAVRAILDDQAQVLGLVDVGSVMPAAEAPLLPLCERFIGSGRDIVLFEGYGADPVAERADDLERLGVALRARGLTVIQSSREGALRWLSKPSFCTIATDIHGVEATPGGASLDSAEPRAVLDAVDLQLARGASRVIVKVNESGGDGNLVIEDRGEAEVQIGSFLSRFPPGALSWTRVEPWVRWESTYCCSFFLFEEGEPFFVALTQQIISEARAAFVGSRDVLDLDEADADAVVDLCRPLARLMGDDGVRGFSGLDVIVSAASGRVGELLLPSGRALRFIECNPRLNGHNQVLKAVSLVAARDGRSPDDFAYWMVRNTPPPGARGLVEVREALRSALHGVADSLTSSEIRPGEVRYLVDTNNGVSPIIYNDAVVFITLRGGAAPALLRAAAARMSELGLASD